MIILEKSLAVKLNTLIGPEKNRQAFEELCDYLIQSQHKTMEYSDSDIEMYRSQGAIQALRELKELYDIVKDSIKRHND